MSMANEMRGETIVTIGDETIDVLLNMNAFRLMCQDRDMELSELDELVLLDFDYSYMDSINPK